MIRYGAILNQDFIFILLKVYNLLTIFAIMANDTP